MAIRRSIMYYLCTVEREVLSNVIEISNGTPCDKIAVHCFDKRDTFLTIIEYHSLL